MPVKQLTVIGGDNRTAQVDARTEYLAGGVLSPVGSGSSQGLRTLRDSADDLMNELSPRIYEQMMQDPEIAKIINILKISVLSSGYEILPAIKKPNPKKATKAELDKYDRAETIAKFCKYAISNLSKPFIDTLEQMLDAFIYGHKIAEITYDTGKVAIEGLTGEMLILKTIKVKARGVVRFVVDNSMNVIGYLPAKNATDFTKLEKDKRVQKDKSIRVTASPEGDALIMGQPILPLEKFMCLTIRSKDGDPRGTSMLRPAFNAWQLKTQLFPEYLRYLLMCAIPLLVGYTPENVTGKPELQRGTDGEYLRDSEGRFVEANPVAALRDALVQARNATTLALKGGSKIQEIGAQGAGTPFYKAIEVFDSQMEKGILLQTLATSEGIHQNRAASQTAMTVLEELVYRLKGVVVSMLKADLLRPLVQFNFGDDSLELIPEFHLGDTERANFSIDGQTVATLYGAGYLDDDQKRYTDAMLGLPVRGDDGEIDEDPLKVIEINKGLQALDIGEKQFESMDTEVELKKAQIRTQTLQASQLEAGLNTINSQRDQALLELNKSRLEQLALIKQLLSGTQIVNGKNGAQVLDKPRDLTQAERNGLDSLLRNIIGDAVEVETALQENTGIPDINIQQQPLPDQNPGDAPAPPTPDTGNPAKPGTPPTGSPDAGKPVVGNEKDTTPTPEKGRTALAPVPIPAAPKETDTTGKVPVIRTGNNQGNERGKNRGATRTENIGRLTGKFGKLDELIEKWNGTK